MTTVDMNGDSKADLVLGSPYYNDGTMTSGVVSVLFAQSGTCTLTIGVLILSVRILKRQMKLIAFHKKKSYFVKEINY